MVILAYAGLERGFFGGKPLLGFELMRELTAYARERAAASGHGLGLNVTTNGTILSSSILDFLAAEGVGLCVSMDGVPEVHARNRVDGRGLSRFPLVERNLRAALEALGTVQVNAVYGPETLSRFPLPRVLSVGVAPPLGGAS